MILYKGGKKVKDVSELEDGQMYCIGNIGGVLDKECYRTGYLYKFTAKKECVVLFLDEDSITERIKCGLVRRVLADSKATKKTLQKLFNKSLAS